MDRLDGLLGNMSGSSNRGAHSGEANRETSVNFNKHPNRGRTYGSSRGRGNSSSNATGINRPGGGGTTNTRRSSTGSRPTSSERPMRAANATGRGDSTSWTTRIKEDLIPAIPTESGRIVTIKRDIHVIQWQWPQHLNL